MDSIRIAILSANNTPIAFMDNAHKKSMHYWVMSYANTYMEQRIPILLR